MSRQPASIKHIVVQAGGEGTRMRWFTTNKPKALISVGGEPMLLRLMRQHPEAQFYIVAAYKAEVLKAYLKKFAQGYRYKIVVTQDSGTCAGLRQSLHLIPAGEPLLITWCDLYVKGRLYGPAIDATNDNYLGLSNTFPCRWSYESGQLQEAPSNTHGVAGVYIFQDKKELSDVPDNGEFCRYLQVKGLPFKHYFLKDVYEVGTLEAYAAVTQNLPATRPFNKLTIKNEEVIKEPLDDQGRQLAAREVAWYRAVSEQKFDFLPKVFRTDPLTLQKLPGSNLFDVQLPQAKKRQVLSRYIEQLKALHELPIKKTQTDFYANDYKALIGKTKERLDSIANLVPFSDGQTIIINGRQCKNFYQQWERVEKFAQQFLGKSEYRFIHGDPTFSNTLYDTHQNKVYFIDPRGYYGDVELLGDPDYDWAKAYYSLVGNYDQFNRKKFQLVITEEGVELDIESSGWESTEADFFKLTKANATKINFIHAIIWLSLASYAWDDYDSICGAFYNGIYLMQELLGS